MKNKLNPKQEKFAQLFATKGNATECYVEAGYAKKGARQAASKLLTNADVLARVAELREKVADKEIITREELVQFLADVVRTPVTVAAMSAYPDEETGTPANPLIESVTPNQFGLAFKMPSKMDAVKTLIHIHGWNEPEKVEHGIDSEMIGFFKELTGSNK